VPPITPTVDAPVVQRLKNAGAIIVGKTNLHEFAFGTTSEESAFGPVRNPYDESRSAGGSSGGAAAALATGMCFGAIGTDTGGSIRIPAAACGTVGLKPTSGEVSTDGVVPLSATLDHVGPMTRGVADAALMSSTDGELGARVRHVRECWAFRVQLCDRLDAGVGQALSQACDALVRRGYSLRDVVIDDAAWTPDVYLHIVLPEASWYHARSLELHGSRYSPGVRLRLEMGRYVLAEDYIRAMRLRDVLVGSVDRALDGCDALLLPALPIAAPPLGAATVDVGGTIEPVRAAMLRLTQLFNVTGHPAIALPTTTGSDGLPRGLQLVGRRHATAHLLDVAASVEACLAGDC
jgi:aspartyl-tRNA(Asn)/glutamyl-tRNA(Gln) amidotransferase subunit A